MGGDAGDVDHAAVLLLAVRLHLLHHSLDHEAGARHVNSDTQSYIISKHFYMLEVSFLFPPV